MTWGSDKAWTRADSKATKGPSLVLSLRLCFAFELQGFGVTGLESARSPCASELCFFAVLRKGRPHNNGALEKWLGQGLDVSH